MLHRSRVFHHFIVLAHDLVPVHNPRKNGCKVGQARTLAWRCQHQFLARDRLEPRGQFEAEKMCKGEPDGTLAVGIDILALDFHVRAMTQHTLDHGRDLGRGTALELGIDAGCLALDMPIDHHPPAPIAGMPFRHEISIPGTELRGIRSTGCPNRTPDLGIANGQRGVGHPGTGGSQRRGIDVASVNMGKFVDADVLGSGGNPFETGIGAGSIQGQEQTPVANIMRQYLTAGRAFKAIQELRIERGLLQDIEKTRHRPGPADLVLQLDQSRGLRLAIERCDTDQVLPGLSQPDHAVLRQRRVQQSQFFFQAGTDICHERTGVLLKAEFGVIGFAALVEISWQIMVRIPVAVSSFNPDFPGTDAVAELAQHAEFVGYHVQPALAVNNKLLPAGRNGSGRRNSGRHCPAPFFSQADDQFHGTKDRMPDRIVRPEPQNRQELR